MLWRRSRPRAQRRALETIVGHYLGTGDFNGLYLGSTDRRRGLSPGAVAALVRAELVAVVSEDDFINPYVRPWPPRRSVEDQVETVRAASAGDIWGCCLYPTGQAMALRDLSEYDDRPYARAMAGGRGHLELTYFTIDVISDYRDDPRYHFSFDDFGAQFGVGDDAYLDESEPERDKIHSINVGFAYDTAALHGASADVRRYVCAFYGDLAKFTPDHQQRWRTRRVEAAGSVHPHPVWWQMQRGEWPDAVGPFQKILGEMAALNELWALVYGRRLFRKTDRPRNWGWVLRPSSGEWENFVQTTDKLLSDNIDHKSLTAAGVPRNNEEMMPLGSLTRLLLWLTTIARVSEDKARGVLAPLFDIRGQRNPAAHDAKPPVTDRTLIARQRDLLGEAAASLQALREFLATHPEVRAAGWTAEEYLTGQWYVL